MSENRLPDYLDHIQQAATDARSFVEGMAKDDFLADKRTQQAVIMSLIVIGEAATKVMDGYVEFTQAHADVPWLENQIQLIKPKCIVALGATALSGLTGKSAVNITKDRGIWQQYGSISLLPTFHPAYLLRFPAAKKNAWDDLKAVLKFLGKMPPSPQKNKGKPR